MCRAKSNKCKQVQQQKKPLLLYSHLVQSSMQRWPWRAPTTRPATSSHSQSIRHSSATLTPPEWSPHLGATTMTGKKRMKWHQCSSHEPATTSWLSWACSRSTNHSHTQLPCRAAAMQAPAKNSGIRSTGTGRSTRCSTSDTCHYIRHLPLHPDAGIWRLAQQVRTTRFGPLVLEVHAAVQLYIARSWLHAGTWDIINAPHNSVAAACVRDTHAAQRLAT